MNIFFLGARGNDELINVYSQIVKLLIKQGHKVDAGWLNKSANDDALDFETSYKRNMASIKNCDMIVAETTNISSGVGFQIATALNEKKPVLALFNKNSNSTPSATLKGSSNKNKLLTYKEYTNNNEIEGIVKLYTKEIKSLLDTKFILIISPEIDRYLEWASENKRMHKAQIVRNAIEDFIRKDKEYKV